MNRIYSLVWNRALHTMQVASELARPARGGCAAATGASSVRRRPLALACAAVLAMTAFALPAWSATCVSSATQVCGVDGGNGGNASYGVAGTGGVGSNPEYNNGGDGGVAPYGSSGPGQPGQGAGGSGAGGSLVNAGVGSGGSGGRGYTTGGGSAAGGGGGGGGGVGVVISGSAYYGASSLGGSGGTGGFGAGRGNGGQGGGGGSAAWLASGSDLTLGAGAIFRGGAGGNGIFKRVITVSKGGAGNGGAAISGVDFQLTNQGTAIGGDGGAGAAGDYASYSTGLSSGTNGGAGGAGVDGSNFTLINQGDIAGGEGGAAGLVVLGGRGGAGVDGTGFGITNQGAITGGVGGNGGNAGTSFAQGVGGAGGAGITGDGIKFLTNESKSTIVGGQGGSGGDAGYYRYASAGAGGRGGDGASVSGNQGTPLTNDGSIEGGAGGGGGSGAGIGGGHYIFLGGNGGVGGTGLEGSGFALTNQGSVAGGIGGVGGSGSGSSGGVGGAGISGSNFTLTNFVGSRVGGGAGGTSTATGGKAGVGGVGLVGSGGAAVVNAGTIAGGVSGDGKTQADAVDFSGGGNALTLENGFSFTGNVISTSVVGTNGVTQGDTLALGGDSTADGGTGDGTFNLSDIVTTAPTSYTGTTQYYGFTAYQKTGGSSWILTGIGTGQNWLLQAGTLQLGDGITAASLTGDASSATVTVGSGTTLNVVAHATLSGGNGGAAVSSSGSASVTTSGKIAGGKANGGTGAQADAVDFSGGGNSLTLESGFSFTGNVVSTSGTGAPAVNGGDTLALGGDTNDTFDVSNIVDSLPAGATTTQYVGFNQFAKTGSSTWVVTSTTASVTPWTLDDGTLSVSSDTNLGAAAGTLTFAGGTLENTAAFSTARNVALNSTGAFQTDADLTVSGVISGNGSIAKTGSATLTLPNANTFTGGTNVDAGEVDVGNDASLGTGAVAMAAGTTLGFTTAGLDVANGFALSGDPAFNVAAASQTDTVSGVIADGSAPGVLEKTGNGALVLLGANTWTGGTTISAGTLQVGNGGTSGAIGTGAIVDNGTLVFDRSDAVELPAGLTGTGALIQQGSGTFTVNGDDSAFAGTTTIKSGTATVGDDSHAVASLGGMVAIAKGATLTGIGTIGGMDLAGTLSPGGSIGTFHVTGDATFETGSTFNIEAAPDGTADQLAVGGKTTIKGGNTVVIAQPGNWNPQTTYTIITSGGGVTGTFAGVSDDQAFLTPSLGYKTNAVTLTLARNDINFAAVAATVNQRSVAAAENALGFGNPLYDAVVRLTAADARIAFDQTSGEYHASQQTARIDDSRYIREAMNQRLRAGDNDPEADKVGNLTAWAHAWGHWGTVDGDGNAAKLADNGDGLLIGADLPVGTQARIGVTGGASRNSLSVNDRNAWGRETSTWLGAFAGYDAGALGLRGGVAYAWDRIPTNREVNFPGYTDRLSGNASGDTLTGFIEGAWTFHFASGTVSPFLNVAHTRVETDASTEAGGAAALHAFDATENVSFSTLGARGEINLAHHLNVHGELGWQHALGDTTPEANLQFVAGGPAFTEYGVPVAKNAGLGRIGIGWHQGNIAVDADYEGLAGNGVKDQAAKVSVSVKF